MNTKRDREDTEQKQTHHIQLSILSAIIVSFCTMAFAVPLFELWTARDVHQPPSFRFLGGGQAGSAGASSEGAEPVASSIGATITSMLAMTSSYFQYVGSIVGYTV